MCQKFQNMEISKRFEGSYLQRTFSRTINEETLTKALNFIEMV